MNADECKGEMEMRLAVFNDSRLGIVDGDTVVDVSDVVGAGPDWPPVFMLRVIADWRAWKPRLAARLQDRGAARLPLAGVVLRPPVPWPSKIIAAPVNYRAHQAELTGAQGVYAGQTIKTVADYGLFLKPPSSLVGHEAQIVLPFPDRRTDHEAEIGIVIGRTVRNLTPAEAPTAVFGYTGLLDLTVRGPEDRPWRKGFDGFTPLGPWLVTAEEIPDPSHWSFCLTVNGQVRQRGDTTAMIYNLAQLVALASYQTTLYPGDIIASGTPDGIGPVRPGDRLELHIDHIGTLAVSIADEVATPEKVLSPWADQFIHG
jgi:2-keto-4-pentenoate hydratase/2-oxohepta-3-ene-1,7-dioic acid hydratase in catechol pathway